MNCLVWTLILISISSWSFGRYFLAKDLLRQKKILLNDVSGELVGFPIAFCTMAVGVYLYNKYLIAPPTLPDHWNILLAIIITGWLPLSYLFGKHYTATKCKKCGGLAIYEDDKKEEYCKYCKQALQGPDNCVRSDT